MAEWFTPLQRFQAIVAWVVDDSTALEHVAAQVAEPGVALLVPEGAHAPTNLCRTEACGLYYRDGHEAAAMIAYLLEHPEERKHFARNVSRVFSA
jgi:hypothetical protein